MPLIDEFYYENAKIGIWHITEANEFFEKKYKPIKSISHPKNKVLHAAAWYTALELAKPLVIVPAYLQHGAPADDKNNIKISLSHTYIYAAACIHNYRHVGIDIEMINSKAIIVKEKFANNVDVKTLATLNFNNNAHAYSLLWSIKEAAYKCMHIKGVTFKTSMSLIAAVKITAFNFKITLKWNNKILYGEAKSVADMWVTYFLAPL